MSKKSENPVIARLRTDAANSRRRLYGQEVVQ